MSIDFNNLDKITFDGAVYSEVTKAADNTNAITQEKSNVTYDNFLLHSSKEWLSTIQDISTEIVKEVKDTSDKVKADNKVIEAAKKAAPDAKPFKDTENNLKTGVTDLIENMSAMNKINDYSGAINFITSTAVNTITGSIVNISDMGTLNKSPSITNTANVLNNNGATVINYSDTIFTKTKAITTLADESLLSAANKHNTVTNTDSLTTTSSKTTAVKEHQVVTTEQKQYSNNFTNLSNETTLIGSKGTTNLISQEVLIGGGQTNKTGTSQAVTGQDRTNKLLNGKVTIVSTGDVTTLSAGTISNQGDTFGANAQKIGFQSIDTASNSTTTTIASKVQTTLTSDGVTYTGNRNVGISINPFGMLAGRGIAPSIPFLSELLPPINIEIPELPEFPFGSLADFLSKCLPFKDGITITSGTETPTANTDDSTNLPSGPGSKLPDGPKEKLPDGPNEDDEDPLITLEDPLVIQSKGDIDKPIDISKQGTTKEAPSVKGVKTVQTGREVSVTPSVATKAGKEVPFGPRQSIAAGAKIGILNKVCIDTPEESIKSKTTTSIDNSTTTEITPAASYADSLKSINSMQKSQVVNSFNKDQRKFIDTNYKDFTSAISLVDVFKDELDKELSTNVSKYSKITLDILKNKSYIEQIKTFLNSKRPTGVGGQQLPPNIQDDISFTTSYPITAKTPPSPGQGILDVLTAINLAEQGPSVIKETTEGWFSPTDIEERDIAFGEEYTSNIDMASISNLLNNDYLNIIKQVIPNEQIQSALSLTQDIVKGNIKTPEEYATRLAALVGGDISGYIGYAQQAISIYKQVEAGNYSSLLGIPGIDKVLGAQGTAIASKVLDLISKKNITDKDIYSVVGSIFTGLTGIGIPLLDELAKLLGCVDSLKQQEPFLQNITNSDLQDIIDYLPRIIQTVEPLKRSKILNITVDNCGQIQELEAEEATINVTEIGQGYIRFSLSNKELLKLNNKPLPDIETPVNTYVEYYTDRVTNKTLTPYKLTSQFTSNVLEYKITSKLEDTYTARLNNPDIQLYLEDVITGSLYQYTSKDIGNRLVPYLLDSYILL